MHDYKTVRSGLDISRSIAYYLEMSDPKAFRLGDRAETVKMINDILQGRSDRSVESLLSELKQKGGSYYAGEINVLRRDVQDFLYQKELLSRNYGRSSGMTYKFKTYRDSDGRSLKIVDQKLFDKAARHGFSPGFFRETYFDQVKLYCLPPNADAYGSLFQSCAFAVCRISSASFIGANLYSSEFYSCALDHTDFFAASFANTHFHDSTLSHVTFQNARLKNCNTIDCALENINYLNAALDDCSFGRVNASSIYNLDAATITQGGATSEECRRNKDAVFQGLCVEQEAT